MHHDCFWDEYNTGGGEELRISELALFRDDIPNVLTIWDDRTFSWWPPEEPAWIKELPPATDEDDPFYMSPWDWADAHNESMADAATMEGN